MNAGSDDKTKYKLIKDNIKLSNTKNRLISLIIGEEPELPQLPAHAKLQKWRIFLSHQF